MTQPHARTTTYRGELRCFSCARYLGEFESHPEAHGARDLHLIAVDAPEARRAYAVKTERGLRCSQCGGRALTEWVERVAA